MPDLTAQTDRKHVPFSLPRKGYARIYCATEADTKVVRELIQRFGSDSSYMNDDLITWPFPEDVASAELVYNGKFSHTDIGAIAAMALERGIGMLIGDAHDEYDGMSVAIDTRMQIPVSSHGLCLLHALEAHMDQCLPAWGYDNGYFKARLDLLQYIRELESRAAALAPKD